MDRADNNQPRAQSVRGSRLLKVQLDRDSRLPRASQGRQGMFKLDDR